MPVVPVPVVNTIFSREKLLQVARTLPADLEVLSQLGEMLQDFNSELDEIAGLLRRDVALATRIVRISNSPVYGGGGQIASTEEAVNRVGFSEILKLVGTATAARMADRALEFHGVSAQILRDNMLYGAFAAEAIARAVGSEPREAYTAGLLRTLGVMVLDRAGRGQLSSNQHYTPERWPDYPAWETKTFGIQSCDVAALILDEWRFPARVGVAIRAHYLARLADYDHPLAVVLNVANGLAHQAGRSFAGEHCWWEITPRKLEALGLSEEDVTEAGAAAESAFDAANAALSA
jgi:HD-like signal output (HDOD) protein